MMIEGVLLTDSSSKGNVHTGIPTVSVSHDAYNMINHALNQAKDVRVLWDDERELSTDIT